MRLLETIPDPPTKPNSKPESEHCYPIKVITALVGGGARSKQLDPVSVVRPQSVRGHLRFWWRLTAGASLSVNMRTAEAAIFGNTKQQSVLKIRITTEQSKLENSQDIGKWKQHNGKRKFHLDDAVPSYAAFPFRQEAENQTPITKVLTSVQFKLHLNFGKLGDEQQKQVITALKCWVNFGGIGSRTRRGFGALECEALMFNDEKSLKDLVNQYFCDHKLSTEAENSPDAAWQYAIQRLQMFRQVFDENEKSRNYVDNNPQAPPSVYVGIGRKTKSNSKSPSYSYWPEAPLVRRIVNQLRPLPHCFHDDGHHPVMDRAVLLQLTPAEDDRAKKGASAEEDDSAKKGAFPRALFGLPIEFWMKCQQWDRTEPRGQRPHRNLNGRQEQHSIKPKLVPAMGGKPLDRFASPLILRPIKIGGQYHALALVLKHDKHPDGVILQNGDNKIKFAWQSVSDTQSLRYDTSPLKVGKAPNPDALSAFLDYFIENSANKNHASKSHNAPKNNNSPKNDASTTPSPPTPQTVRGQVHSNRGSGALILQYLNVKRIVSPAEAEQLEALKNPKLVQLTLLGTEVIKIEPITPKATTP